MDNIKISIESRDADTDMEEPMAILLMEPETILTTQDNENIGKLTSFKVCLCRYSITRFRLSPDKSLRIQPTTLSYFH